jgi:8-oxo-dGTP diphosphatase
MALAGHWEFPGGKLEGGESLFDCIVREIDEELSMSISPTEALPHVFHDYGDFQIELHPVLCEVEDEAFELREHRDAGWFAHDELARLKWAPADLPIVNQLIKGKL